MWQAMRTHFTLFFSFGILMLGTGLQNSLIGLRARHEGFGSTSIGLIMASFYLGFLVSSLMAARYISRVGHIRVFAALSALCSITILFHGLWINAPFWFVVRFITGFCISGLFILCESWLNAQSSNHQRGQSLAAYITVLYLAQTLSQVFLFWANATSFLLFAFVSVCITLAPIPMLLTRVNTPALPEQPSTMRLSTLYRRSPLGIIGLFCGSFTIGSVTSLAVVFAANSGFNDKQAGYLVMALNIGCVLGMSPLGKLSDIFDRRIVLCIAAALSACIALITVLFAQTLLHLLGLFVLLGAVCLPMNSICSAYINDWLYPEEVLPAAGAIVLTSGIASVFGPLVTGALIDGFSNQMFFYVVIVVMSFFAIFAIYRMTQRSTNAMLDNTLDAMPMANITASTFTYAYDDKQLHLDFSQSHSANHTS